MPPESQSDTVTADSLAVQVIAENADLVEQYTTGDLSALSALQQRAVEAAAGRVNEPELKNSLMRKLGVDI